MLTIFTIPKPFTGHTEIIQRNAIESWKGLGADVEVVLLGDDAGVKLAAQEHNVKHYENLPRNQYGTPLLNSAFSLIENNSTTSLLCYVNSDIILTGEFLEAVKLCAARFHEFLMIGQCWDLRVDNLVYLNSPNWRSFLSEQRDKMGKKRGASAMDYFVFTRGAYANMPPFAVGRAWFDLWLVWQARQSCGVVVDATRQTRPIHQNHDYSHVKGGKAYSYGGIEAQMNFEMAGGEDHLYNMDNATHLLTNYGFRINPLGYFLSKKQRDIVMKQWWKLVTLSRPLRHKIGLHSTSAKRIIGVK